MGLCAGVLTWQAGDCFDFSSVLVSLLTGVGYDAYCVMGYAPKAVTFSDQELLTCPILEREAALRLAEANRPKPKPEVATKYRVKEALALESNFDREMYDKEMARIMEEQRQVRPRWEDGAYAYAWIGIPSWLCFQTSRLLASKRAECRFVSCAQSAALPSTYPCGSGSSAVIAGLSPLGAGLLTKCRVVVCWYRWSRTASQRRRRRRGRRCSRTRTSSLAAACTAGCW